MKLKTFVSILLLVIIMAAFFMGQYYQTLGDKVGTTTLTLIVFALMACLLWAATAARQREGAFSKALHILGIALGIIYIVGGLFYIVPIGSHYFYINADRKNIQQDVAGVIASTDSMFANYKQESEDRAESLNSKIKREEYNQGHTNFSLAYPGKQYSLSFARTEKQTFLKQLLEKYNQYYTKDWKSKSAEYRKYLVDNWNIFSSSENIKQLDNDVETYSNVLKSWYETTLNPYEKMEDDHPQFNKSVSAKDLVEKFTSDKTNTVSNLFLGIMLILSSSSFIFVQNKHVKMQKKNDPVYELGFDL